MSDSYRPQRLSADGIWRKTHQQFQLDGTPYQMNPSSKACRPIRAALHRVFTFPATLGLMLVATGSLAADEVIVEHDVMIPMRDGTLLTTDIYRPLIDGVAEDESRSVLLTRSPYNKIRQRDVDLANHLVRHRYVAAIQDIRGRFGLHGQAG